jgi:ferredoxin
MHIGSDRSRCDGFASCVIVAPAVFDLAADNLIEILDAAPADAQRAEVEEAVRACPTGAIWIEKE